MTQLRKRFGQHFLEPVWAEKVVTAMAPAPTDAFIEIGPGRGVLTRLLLRRVGSLVAFEIDRDLAAGLRMAELERLTVVEGDFLETDWFSTHPADQPLRVAGNLPYNVTSPILFRLLALHAGGAPLLDATLMLQFEVAERILAAPGTHEYGVLSILVRHRADVERCLTLPPGAFRPAPKVRSALIRFRFRDPRPLPRDMRIFEGVVRSVFTRRRKTLGNALQVFAAPRGLDAVALLQQAGIDPQRRPETLSIEEFVHLADVIPTRPS